SEHCQSCHSTIQAPFFAKDDLVAAHSISLSNELVTLNQPSTSKLYLKVLYIHNCWSGNCSDDAEVILTSIQSWAEALNVEPVEKDEYITGSLVVPAILVNIGTNETLEFSLNGVAPSVPSDSILQLTIERFSEDSYRIKELKMQSSQSLAVKSLSIIINRADSQVNGVFKQIDTIIPANILTSLSDGSQFALVGFNLPQATGGPSIDEISVQFESIATPDSLFLDMKDDLAAGCSSCHSQIKNFIYNAYNGAQRIVPDFINFDSPGEFLNHQVGTWIDNSPRYFVVPGDAENSVLYRAVMKDLSGHNYLDVQSSMPINGDESFRQNLGSKIAAWIDSVN
ncbi:MAG: hypothetical protein GW917_04010, partial [Bdellovibrionales bacterium]|nr:hypothetical protein [Bdellovibrionales bacterium]